ncbi:MULTISPECIES: pantoate--beta-alanine ligase [unclassified Wenzhouxiangella]|uniref:pantoate--beta-alanine ligase n=1 Tax=unclassified Wenzhouxiangella TaxID=2613841 RepID=UPI000E32A30A|nr:MULTISPECIES: pantoate--beta-alanine ligase [unclassified Wenzhouxiangella]RFF26598.1 pantoate--beta-alanine ligase [Wenzhouxiangella sp. 15181]RFP67653.1 pantoate--beta-alanine ligase [Wenzhouxiangella sp. 15190]
MPRVDETLPQLRESVGRLRERGDRIGFVPTMGNLHRGHLSLVEEAGRHCEATVASIFVNPTQFGPGEDFDAYPRTFEADLDALESVGCDLVWAPSVATMYPLEPPFMVHVPEALSDCLCGRSRPGHFDGVATVVLRLLNQVAPDVAVFGEKDYQQLLILRQMAGDFALPVEIHGAPIVREEDGLAMSSRNGYLDEEQRAVAPMLYRVLDGLAGKLAAGGDFESLKRWGLEGLRAAGFRPDYLEWRSAEDLGEPKAGVPSRVFGAAWLGKARLIDNLPVPLTLNT